MTHLNPRFGLTGASLLGVFLACCSPAANCTEASPCAEPTRSGDAGAGDPALAADAGTSQSGETRPQPDAMVPLQPEGSAGGGGTAAPQLGEPAPSTEGEGEDAGTVGGDSPEVPLSPDAGDVSPDLTTITVRNLEDPMTPPELVLVVVSAPDGALIASAHTDVEGQVQLDVPLGSTVTAIAESNYTYDGEPESDRTIQSWFDVPDADQLYVNIWRISGDIVTVDSPTMAINANLVANIIGTPGDTGVLQVLCNKKYYPPNEAMNRFFGTYLLTDIRTCPGTDEVEVWGFARGGWGYQTVAMEAGATKSLVLVADDTRWDTSTLYLQGIPAGTTYVDYGVQGSMKEMGGGLSYRSHLFDPLYSEGSLSVQIPHAPFHQLIQYASTEINDNPRITASVARSGAAVLEWNVTENLALVAELSPVDRQIVAQPVVGWWLAPAGQLGDYLRLYFSWGDVRWIAHVPSGRQGTVQLPALPAAAATFAPSPEVKVSLNGAVVRDDLLVDGYAEVLSQPYDDEPRNYNQTSYWP